MVNSEAEHLQLEPQDKTRARYGVVSCLQVLKTGEVRLILDDVCSKTDHWPQAWQWHSFFTQKDFDDKQFLGCELSEEQLARIGLALVARLAALTTSDEQ